MSKMKEQAYNYAHCLFYTSTTIAEVADKVVIFESHRTVFLSEPPCSCVSR